MEATATMQSAKTPHSSFSLTKQDVERLLSDTSSDSRIDVLNKVAEGYKERAFQPEEFLIAEQIFRLLLRDTESKVRKSLAEQFKAYDKIPRDVIVGLAKDVESVALPILESSQILSDADLLEIIDSSREVNKLDAIANRNGVSERVSDALIDTQYPEVVRSLVKNHSAKISDDGFGKILTDHGNDELIQEGIVSRESLSPAITEKLITMVSDALADQIAKKFDVDAKTIREQAAEAREKLTLDILDIDTPEAEVTELAKAMEAADRLSPSIIMSSLCSGYLLFFENALAVKANIPVANAQKLISDKGKLGFEALYQKTGLPMSMYDATKALLNVVQTIYTENMQKNGLLSNRIAERLLQYADGKEIENISYVLALVRQGKR